MKKILLIISTFILVACSSSNIDIKENKTCTISSSQIKHVAYEFESTNNIINQMNVIIEVNGSDVGLNDELSNLSDQDKDRFVGMIINTLGLDGTNHEGLSVDYKIDADTIILTLNLDLEKCDEDTLSVLGIQDDLKLNETIEQFVANGFDCN